MNFASNLNLRRDGAELAAGAALPILPDLLRIAESLNNGSAGLRLTNNLPLRALFLADGAIGSVVARHMGKATRPVRAILFDKNPATNWALGWHQDRTIAVKQRIDAEGFGPWTIKQGITHVAPPIALLERMMTIRVHLDNVSDDNAPLLIALGSHKLGRIAEADIENLVAGHGTFTCTAKAGDIWLYATPILHASDRAERPTHRRVLQVDYSADALPDGLEWQGV